MEFLKDLSILLVRFLYLIITIIQYMVEIFQYINVLLGILIVFISGVLAIIAIAKFKESKSKIKIDSLILTSGQLENRSDNKESYRGPIILGFMPFKYTKKYLSLNISFDLINKPNNPTTIYGIHYYWESPSLIPEKFIPRNKLLGNNLNSCYSENFGDGFTTTNIKIGPSSPIHIEDKIYVPEFVNYYIKKNYDRWKKEYEKKYENRKYKGLEYKGLPPSFSIKMEILDIKGRRTIISLPYRNW